MTLPRPCHPTRNPAPQAASRGEPRTGNPNAPSIRAELAAAVRRVNVHYSHVPEPEWPDVDAEAWHALEAEVDTACRLGDRMLAMRAISAWEAHALEVLGRRWECQ